MLLGANWLLAIDHLEVVEAAPNGHEYARLASFAAFLGEQLGLGTHQ